MKVVILAGGFGTRLSEYTELIPKPMVSIGNRPILWHIMNSYAQYGYKDFYLALGYKADMIKDYFLNYNSLNTNFTVDLLTGAVETHGSHPIDWRVTLVDTGLDSMTGGRVKRMKKFLGEEPFLLTYGDGLSNININDLVNFHKRHGKMATVSAVHPAARFGELEIEGDKVISFMEKPQTQQGWINGGYFVLQPEFLDLIEDDMTILESQPLETVSKMNQLIAYKHNGFWQCMDTKRDRDLLEELWNERTAPWNITQCEN